MNIICVWLLHYINTHQGTDRTMTIGHDNETRKRGAILQSRSIMNKMEIGAQVWEVMARGVMGIGCLGHNNGRIGRERQTMGKQAKNRRLGAWSKKGGI